MAEPYDPYAPSAATSADGASIARSSFAGYIPSEPSSLASPYPRFSKSSELRGIGSDYLQNDINLSRLGPYSVDAAAVGSRVLSEPDIKGYSPLDDPVLRTKRDASLGVNPDISIERPIPKTNHEAPADSNVLFVDGLPRDCTRREVGHLFRPFIGYKDIRVVHKEPRRSGDKAMVLCFVEFVDAKCALTALEALQGYKFDDKKPDSRTLKIQFAHFPFRPPADNGTTT